MMVGDRSSTTYDRRSVATPDTLSHTEEKMTDRPKARHDRGLLLIAIFKFAKFVILLALGFGALQLLRPEVAEGTETWAAELSSRDERRVLQYVLERASGISDARLRALGIGCFIYAAVFLTEGIGLYLERRWAEYLTVVATGSLVPIELYELAKHVTLGKIAILVVNLAIVAYLVYRLRSAKLSEAP